MSCWKAGDIVLDGSGAVGVVRAEVGCGDELVCKHEMVNIDIKVDTCCFFCSSL